MVVYLVERQRTLAAFALADLIRESGAANAALLDLGCG
jgi:hypothetical protein